MKYRLKMGVSLGEGKFAFEGDEVEYDELPVHLIGKVEMVNEKPKAEKPKAKSTSKSKSKD